ncbi:MAG: hypothetical protein K8S25_16745 [Alphaproteobacteria bacterium]|nr:hypothetical protein [Alphaproteobacteria bacterium]
MVTTTEPIQPRRPAASRESDDVLRLLEQVVGSDRDMPSAERFEKASALREAIVQLIASGVVHPRDEKAASSEAAASAAPVADLKQDDGERDTRISLRLSPDVSRLLKELAKEQGNITVAETLRRAIGTEAFLLQERSKGRRILVEDDKKALKELVFR